MPASELESAIDETVEAYAAMSRDRVGALTVFERNSILDTCLSSGTPLDAAVSSELLKNIFWPNAPMHDGALVIRNGRVAGAGCVLPLSENTKISKELGMRHRAGIGMSEISDALILIVSEETGIISMAQDGKLSRFLDLKAVEKALLNLYLPKKPDLTAVPMRGFSIFRKGGSDGQK